MPAERAPLIEVTRLLKRYHGLRPLRVKSLSIAAGDRVAISGLDTPAAEVFVNLLTGAALPDEGEVRVFGTSTAAIMTDTQWLGSLDRFGIVSHRAVLLDACTVEQNLAMPFTLEIDPIQPEVRGEVASLAADVGLDRLTDLAGRIGPVERCRLHLGRALALRPSILVLEHATASVPDEEVTAFGLDLVRLCDRRGLALLALTEDRRFAELVATRCLDLKGATGELSSAIRRRLIGWS